MYERTWKDEQIGKLHKLSEIAGVGAAAIAGACMITILMHGCTDAIVNAGTEQIRLSAEQEQYKYFFKAQGSKEPEAMAIAVSHTKNPKLMAAIAVVESNGNPKAVGDSGASIGAFQVQPRHWGKVSSDNALMQALQAEKILDELLADSRGRLRQSLARYNGGTRPPARSYRYADKILMLTREI